MDFRTYLGDSKTLSIPLRWEGSAFTPSAAWDLIFTAKDDLDDADTSAIIQKTSTAGITTSGTKALVALVHADTAEETARTLQYDIQGQNTDTGEVRTLARGALRLVRDSTRELDSSIPIVTTNPPSLRALANLSDVTLTSPATGDVLVYNASTSKWENSATTSDGRNNRGKILKTTTSGELKVALLEIQGYMEGGSAAGNLKLRNVNGDAVSIFVANNGGTSAGDKSYSVPYNSQSGPNFAMTDRTDGLVSIGGVSGLSTALSEKQATLVSGTNIKTINGTSLLGSGNISVSGGTWGSITGTLSSQTDLVTELDKKHPIRRHVVVGDSLSSTGSGSATTSWAAYWSRQNLNSGAVYSNLAIAGRTAAQIDSAHASQVTPLSPNTLGGVGVLFTLCGTNDLNAGTTDTALIALLRSIWSKGRADGYKICAFTITKNGLLDATKEARRVSVNSSIRADSANWDFLVDLDAILPNNADTTYFTGDNLHYNATGGEFIARQVRQVLDGGFVQRANLAMARNVGTFSVPNGSVLTKIPYTTAEVDRAALFSSGTITVKEAGVYCVIASIAPQNASASIRWIMELYKNGSSAYRMLDVTSTDFMLQGSRLVSCAAGDTLEIYASQNHSGSITINSSTPASVFQVFKVSAFP